ncbi:hypothetical protein JCM10908_005283 [Rhodotorula pacifica]|uniref:uncharacterized protein n=1 Tax=Rhodotorula pacifica TaxID=1495444 RepID=UPI00317179E3
MLRRSSLAAAVDSPASAAGATAPVSAARDSNLRDSAHDQNGSRYMPVGRAATYSDLTRSHGSQFADDATVNRPSLSNWGHPPSAPVQGSSRWAESASSTSNAQRPTSVPLPSGAFQLSMPPHRQPHQLQDHHRGASQQQQQQQSPYLALSRLGHQQQWNSKTSPTQYAPYHISIAPETTRHVLPNSEGGPPRMPAYSAYQPDTFVSRASQAPPSYSYAPPSHPRADSAYHAPLSLTLPPLSSSFPSEPFALTGTYPSSSLSYGANPATSYVSQPDPLQAPQTHIPTLGEVYAKTRPPPLTTSLPRANNADNDGFADTLSNSIPAGSAQPNSRKRKEPKDAASRKYLCTECDQKFARPSALATHILTHTREKPFVCMTCNRGFAVMSNLRRHCRVRSHALAPNQESTLKRDKSEGSTKEAGSRSGGASFDREDSLDDNNASGDDPLSHSLPPVPSDKPANTFTLPAEHLYPP